MGPSIVGDSAPPGTGLGSASNNTAQGVLNRINTNNLSGDAFGGLTAAVIALPMALAFGIAVGNASGVPEVGAAAGLWGP